MGKIYLLKEKQFLKYPLKEVFAFFQKPENLSRITPPSLGFQIITPSPVPMKKGQMIDYRIKLLGVSAKWTSLIEEYDPPRKFVDRQIKGPYAYWHHTHVFEEEKGGTWVADEVRYQLPMGMLGRIMHPIYIRPSLERIFNYRQKAIAEKFK